MVSPVTQVKVGEIYCNKIAMDEDYCKTFAKVQSNTASATQTSTSNSSLRKHLKNLLKGGDEKVFHNKNKLNKLN